MGSAFIWPVALHRAFFISSPMTLASAILTGCLGLQIGEHFLSVLYRQIRRTDWIAAFSFTLAFPTFGKVLALNVIVCLSLLSYASATCHYFALLRLRNDKYITRCG